jgi:hypothetical protein
MATTRLEALSAAFEQAEAGTLNAPVEKQIETAAPETPPADPAPDRPRDEHGRFAKAAEPQAPKADEQVDPAKTLAEQVAPKVEEKPVRKPPSSWKKDHWTRWERLASDPELAPLQDYIEQREQDFAKGVSTYKAQWDQAAPLLEAMQPFMPELQQHGIQPQLWIQNLGNAHRTLAMGSPEQKLQMFAKLATEYGVPLNAVSQVMGVPNGQQLGQVPFIDPQFAHLAQTLNAVKNEFDQFKTIQQQQEQVRLQTEVDQFKATVDQDLFEAAKPVMAQLLETGMASDLKTAFEKAIRVDDSLWQQHQAAEQARQAEAAKAEAEKRQKEEAERIAQKKAAAVSPKSASPTGPTTTGGGKDRRSLIAEQLEGLSGRF